MNGTIDRLLHSFANRWVMLTLACVLGLQLGAAPVFAQNSGMSAEQKRKLQKQLQQTYKEGAKAGQAKKYNIAATKFKKSLQLAEKLELDNLIGKIRNNLVKSLKGAASAELEKDNISAALSRYEEVLQYDDRDPVVYLNMGIANLKRDSTEAGLTSLQKAIEIGNSVGNTRVAGRASERIRDEFLATASKALQGENPSQEQINTAIEALDQMNEYVDPNADAKFYRSTALYESGQLKQAMQAAREGLNMHQGSRSDAAKFYFIIAESQFKLGNKSSACQTFENAAYGDYQARAEHYLENECES